MDDTEARDDTPSTEPGAPTRRRSRIGTAMVVVGILLVLAAMPVLIVGLDATSEASDARDRAHAASVAARVEETRRLKLARERLALSPIVTGMPTRAQGFASTVLDVGNAQGRLRDVGNQAARAYNSGDPSGAAALWQNEGKAALDDVTAKDLSLIHI